MYCIIRVEDGKYVADMAKCPTGKSYTVRLEWAKVFPSREAAEAQLCPENERVVDVSRILR